MGGRCALIVGLSLAFGSGLRAREPVPAPPPGGAAGHPVAAATAGGTARPKNQPPVVSLLAPDDGYNFETPRAIPVVAIPFIAEAGDPDGAITKVEFYANAALVGAASEPPYEFEWNDVGPGSYALQAMAYDNEGSRTDSAIVHVTVTPGKKPPEVTFTSPRDGEWFPANSPVTLVAAPSDGDGSIAKVEFFAGKTRLGTATRAPYTVVWRNPPIGKSLVLARVFADNGDTADAVTVVNLRGTPQPPEVRIKQPRDGQFYEGQGPITIRVSATGPDDGVAKVEIYADGHLLGEVTSLPFELVWKNPAPLTHVLRARAYNHDGMFTDSALATVLYVGPVPRH